eukprot:3737131-Amphidinium_carterae.1
MIVAVVDVVAVQLAACVVLSFQFMLVVVVVSFHLPWQPCCSVRSNTNQRSNGSSPTPRMLKPHAT